MTFNSPGIKKVLHYVATQYGTEPEFLWTKTPNNAILRHQHNAKWYAALLVISQHKLGLKGEGTLDIVNLKCDPLVAGSLIDRKSIFPGYHMNKEHWITVLLDGSVKDDEIFAFIDMSYKITQG